MSGARLGNRALPKHAEPASGKLHRHARTDPIQPVLGWWRSLASAPDYRPGCAEHPPLPGDRHSGSAHGYLGTHSAIEDMVSTAPKRSLPDGRGDVATNGLDRSISGLLDAGIRSNDLGSGGSCVWPGRAMGTSAAETLPRTRWILPAR
jgi:hypothetical protein